MNVWSVALLFSHKLSTPEVPLRKRIFSDAVVCMSDEGTSKTYVLKSEFGECCHRKVERGLEVV